VNHSLLAAHTAERIREELRKTGESVRSIVLGTAVGTLYAVASITGLNRSRRARRMHVGSDRRTRRATAETTDRPREWALN
jgi:hypothetical protein